jgi:type 1 glutamine amidotransferase
MKTLLLLMLPLAALFSVKASFARGPKFKALVLYSSNVEPDHVLFANDALKFLSTIAAKDQFAVDATTDWNHLNDSYLQAYRIVIWLNDFPHSPEQRKAFQKYMTHGGAWMGFHVSAYNHKDTHWPWFVDFLGGGVFDANSWPPLPAKLRIDDPAHPVTKDLPGAFLSPANEWYLWKPSPRLNKDVRVLVTLDPSNYPLGLKDVLLDGDLPVVWTNTKYKMIYMNMGHGNKIFTDSTQNRMIENAVLWLGSK